VAALGIDEAEIIGFAEPVGAEAEGFVDATAADSAIVPPAASADKALTHSIKINK
jgi:hypothetical protein